MLMSRGVCALVVLLAFPVGARAASWVVLDATPAHGIAAASVQGFAAALGRALEAQVEVTRGGEAANAPAALASGQASVGAFALDELQAGDPALGMIRVPFLATSFVDARKLWQVLRPRVQAALSTRGMTLLYGVPSSPAVPVSRGAITSMASWRGVKLLLTDPGLEALSQSLGAEPVSAASARAALGSARAQAVFMGAAAAAHDQAWQYASHYLHAPAWFPMHVVAANRGALAALDPTRREAVLRAADTAAAQAWTQAEHDTEQAIQKLRDHGIKTARVPVNMLIRLEALGRDLLFRWSEGAGEAGAELVEAYYAIR